MSATHLPPVPPCVCAWCDRWRDAAGRWHDPPHPHAPDVRVSHGICQDCLDEQRAQDTPPV